MLQLDLPRQFNAAEYFVDRNVAEGRGDKIAIIHEDQRFTYRQVQENVNRTANMLSDLGVRMENRVMLLLRDTPEMIFGFYGAIKLGAVPIPSNILMKAPDFLYMLNDSRAGVLIVDHVFLPRQGAAFARDSLLVEYDGGAGREESRDQYRYHEEQNAYERKGIRFPAQGDGQGRAFDELQESIGRPQHPAEQKRERRTDNQGKEAHDAVSQQVDEEDLAVAGAAALQHGDLVLFPFDDEQGHHIEEKTQHEEHGNLQKRQGQV